MEICCNRYYVLRSVSDCEEAQGWPCAVLEVRVYWDFELLQIKVKVFKKIRFRDIF